MSERLCVERLNMVGPAMRGRRMATFHNILIPSLDPGRLRIHHQHGRTENNGPMVAVTAEHQLCLLARCAFEHLAIGTVVAMGCLTSVINRIEERCCV